MQVRKPSKRKEYGEEIPFGSRLPFSSSSFQRTRTVAMSLTKYEEWVALQAHHEEMKKVHVRRLFTKDT